MFTHTGHTYAETRVESDEYLVHILLRVAVVHAGCCSGGLQVCLWRIVLKMDENFKMVAR